MAAYYMEGEALIWYHDAVDIGQLIGWDLFVKTLQVRFSPIAYNDPIEALIRLK